MENIQIKQKGRCDFNELYDKNFQKMQSKKLDELKRFIELKKKAMQCFDHTIPRIIPQTDGAIEYKKYLNGRAKQIRDILCLSKLKRTLMNIIIHYTKDKEYPDLVVLKNSASTMPVGQFEEALRLFLGRGRRIGSDEFTYEIKQVLEEIDHIIKKKEEDRKKYEDQNHVGSPL